MGKRLEGYTAYTETLQMRKRKMQKMWLSIDKISLCRHHVSYTKWHLYKEEYANITTNHQRDITGGKQISHVIIKSQKCDRSYFTLMTKVVISAQKCTTSMPNLSITNI